MQKILVTDSLFIADEHVALLSDKGLEVIRLDEVAASEDALCAAIKDCTGYILGGIETVTQRVIDAAPNLKVISFTGANYVNFIPAHVYATQKSIAITNCSERMPML